MQVFEMRYGDINARAGLVITDGEHILTCRPTPSSRYPNPKLDIPKGHISIGEKPIDAAIRECHEETNILFEPWKLNKPKVSWMENEALYLWEVRLTELPPIEQLSCASTFIDDATGVRLPEMSGYEYLPTYKIVESGVFRKFQDRLWLSLREYFSDDIVYPFEDKRICADKLNIPDGIYNGHQSAYHITLNIGITFRTIWGIKGRNIPCSVEVKNGFVY